MIIVDGYGDNNDKSYDTCNINNNKDYFNNDYNNNDNNNNDDNNV
jgi:hypothetical protein